ncbi:MAG: iron-containing alcohol dehydrogenase [Gemmatimonadetes bacterium]|nr:iron-containing alcohol dehydrogenase [Gemmatimonadota bacterium]
MTPTPAPSGEFTPAAAPRVLFGLGAVSRLAEEIERLGGRRVFILSGRSVAERTDAVERVRAVVGERCVGVYSGLTMRAPAPAAVEAASAARAAEADTLLGIGGSTVSNAAQTIAVLMVEGIEDVAGLRALGRAYARRPLPPLDADRLPKQAFLPTTLSAGEFSVGRGRVLDQEAGDRIATDHPALHTDLVVLDPELTVGTPDWLWYSTGVKALDHAIERLYARDNQPAADGPALLAAELIFRHLPVSGAKHGDLGARLQCQIAAWLSMMGFPNTLFGLSHALGHALGIGHAVPHGYTSCVTQPYVMEFNRPVSTQQQARLARAIGVDIRGMSDEAAAIEAARAVDRLILELGLPHRIRDLQIAREALRAIAERTAGTSYARNNAIPVTRPEQALEVLEKAW